MEFRVEEVAPCRKKVTVTVPKERVREEFDAQYKEVNDAIVLPGFRPGHAPRRLLEHRFGSKIAQEVKQRIVESAYEKLLEEKKVAPLRRPTVDVEKSEVSSEKAFEFGFEVVTRPEFELPAWQDREVRVPAVDVAESEVDDALQNVLLSEGTLVPADKAQADDVVVLSWAAKEGDATLHQGDDSYYRVGRGVLEGVVAEGLDKALLGAAPGTKAKAEGRTAPDDPRPGMAGKTVSLEVEVREVKRFQPATPDADFLKRHDYDDLDEMRKDLRRRVLRRKERERDRQAEDRLVDELVQASKIPLPAEVVDSAVEGWQARRRVEAQAEGLDEDTVAKELAASTAKVREAVERDLRRHFVLDRIAEAENVAVGEPELMGAVEQIARESGRPAGEVAAQFQQEPERLVELRSHLRHQKAREALRRSARLLEEAAPPPQKAAEKAPAQKPKKGK
jgi:trigger factor